VVNKRHKLAVLSVVADTDYRSFRFLNDSYQRCDAASVACTKSVNLVHNDHRLLSCEPSDRCSQGVGILRLFLPASDTEVVKTLVRAQIFDALFN